MSGEFRATTRIVKDLDTRKFLELRRRAKMNDVDVTVGLPSNKVHKTKDKVTGKFARTAKGAKQIMIALIGAVHEFGSPEKGIPQRPWLRPGIRSGKSDYVRLNRVNLLRIMQGTMTKEVALRQLGAMAVGKVQQYIRQSDHFAPLDPKTVKAKGSSAPLIDTGQMIQSIAFEVGKRTP